MSDICKDVWGETKEVKEEADGGKSTKREGERESRRGKEGKKAEGTGREMTPAFPNHFQHNFLWLV